MSSSSHEDMSTENDSIDDQEQLFLQLTIEVQQQANIVLAPFQDHSVNWGRGPVVIDRIPSTTPGAEPPRDAKDSGKFISFHWKDGKSNPADILSKHWEFATVWPLLKSILFWRAETATQLKGSDRIPSTTPGAEPPRDARDSGSARSHSTHLETSSSNRP